MKSLIIEDTAVIYRIVENILNEFGPTDITKNGLEGIQKAKLAFNSGDYYDLILIDIMLPEINGLDVLANIRNMEKLNGGIKKSKIIMLSSLGQPKYIMASKARGCDSYMLKPIDKYKLLAKLEELKLLNSVQQLY